MQQAHLSPPTVYMYIYMGYTVYTHGLLPTIIIRDLSHRGALGKMRNQETFFASCPMIPMSDSELCQDAARGAESTSLAACFCLSWKPSSAWICSFNSEHVAHVAHVTPWAASWCDHPQQPTPEQNGFPANLRPPFSPVPFQCVLTNCIKYIKVYR